MKATEIKDLESSDIELKLKDERRLHDDSMGRTHALEIKLSELTMRAEAMVQRAKDEFTLALVRKEFPSEKIRFEL